MGSCPGAACPEVGLLAASPTASSHREVCSPALQKAQPATSEREDWFRKAEEAFKRAVDISPLNPDHQGNLGNLYHAWADVTDNPEEKAERLTTALSYYEEAVCLAPQSQGQLLKGAISDAHLALAEYHYGLGDVDRAIEETEAARDAAPAEEKVELDELIGGLKARQIGWCADLEPDCRVDVADIQAVASCWRCKEGDDCYDPRVR